MVYSLSLMLQQWSEPGFEFDQTVEESRQIFLELGHMGSITFGLSSGYWKHPRAVPASGYQTGRRPAPDVFPMPGCNAVSQRFKDLVEEFEPGMHQFFPLALRDRRGEPLAQPYYVFNCLVSLDAVLMAESGLTWQFDGPPGKPFPSINTSSKLVFSKPAIAGRHLWCLHYLRAGNRLFVSDAFYTELKARKIRFFQFAQHSELDIPWIAEEQIQPMLDWEASHEPKDWYYTSQIRHQVLEYRGRLGL